MSTPHRRALDHGAAEVSPPADYAWKPRSSVIDDPLATASSFPSLTQAGRLRASPQLEAPVAQADLHCDGPRLPSMM